MLYLFDDFALDLGRRELRRGATSIAIEPQVFDLLPYSRNLLRHFDRTDAANGSRRVTRDVSQPLTRRESGILQLIASLVAGVLWDRVGHTAVFFYGAIFAAVGIVALLTLMPVRARARS